ncbi:hypothetical protein GE09DRAFT_1210690 [Coniochaeta sp. 2T2.1]|nr:hypothetical protein GE09DRAFT_1210690 [Coniochaeta sp. 2T2.1]
MSQPPPKKGDKMAGQSDRSNTSGQQTGRQHGRQPFQHASQQGSQSHSQQHGQQNSQPATHQASQRSQSQQRGQQGNQPSRPSHAHPARIEDQESTPRQPVNVWEAFIKNDTPPYIREQEAAERARLPQAPTPPQRDLTAFIDEAINGRPFQATPHAGPTDSVDHNGNAVRVYKHCQPRHVSFAPGTAAQRPARTAGTATPSLPRLPTPHPNAPARGPMPDSQRRPSPFPELRPRRPTGPHANEEERHRYEAYARYVERHGRETQEEYRNKESPFTFCPPQSGYEVQQYGPSQQLGPPQQYGPPQQGYGCQQPGPYGGNPPGVGYIPQPPMQYHVPGPILHGPPWQQPFNGHGHPPRGQQQQGPPRQTRNPHNGRYPAIVGEQRGTGPPQQQRQYHVPGQTPGEYHVPILCPRGGDMRNTGAPSQQRPGQVPPGDDSNSVKQERSKHGRSDEETIPPPRRLTVRNPDPEMEQLEWMTRPAAILHGKVDSSPLYGNTHMADDDATGCRRLVYDPTSRFDAWLQQTTEIQYPRDDYFHGWLRAKEEQDRRDAQSGQAGSGHSGGGQMGPLPFDNPPANRPGPPQQPQPLSGNPTSDPPRPQHFPVSSSNADAHKVRKRRAPDDKSEEGGGNDNHRPSKRSRLARTFRRKLSLSTDKTTAKGSYGSSGDILSVTKRRRVSGIDVFNPRSFSSLRAFSTSLSRASNHGPTRVRIAVIGDTGAGKTTMLNRLYTGMYQPAAKSDFYRNNDFPMTVEGHPIILEAWDIPGEVPADETHPLNRSFFDAVLICFSVEDVNNAGRTPHWVTILQSCLVVDIPFYLVGLKSDARPSFPMLRLGFMFEATPTTREQCESIAHQIGAVEYFECSAKSGEGVTHMFTAVIEQVREKKDDEELKRASRLRKERLRRGVQDTGRRMSQMFCLAPGMEL